MALQDHLDNIARKRRERQGQFSMKDITVDKNQLLEKLQANRETHRAQFEEAWEGYYQLAQKEFEERLARVKQGKSFKIHWNLPVPEDHTEDYERAIEMLNWHQEDQITLSEGEFRQFVEDKWNWSGQFTASYSTIQAMNGPHQ